MLLISDLNEDIEYSIPISYIVTLATFSDVNEAVSLTIAYQKVSKYITPAIERKVDDILDKLFPTYTPYIEVVE